MITDFTTNTLIPHYYTQTLKDELLRLGVPYGGWEAQAGFGAKPRILYPRTKCIDRRYKLVKYTVVVHLDSEITTQARANVIDLTLGKIAKDIVFHLTTDKRGLDRDLKFVEVFFRIGDIFLGQQMIAASVFAAKYTKKGWQYYHTNDPLHVGP